MWDHHFTRLDAAINSLGAEIKCVHDRLDRIRTDLNEVKTGVNISCDLTIKAKETIMSAIDNLNADLDAVKTALTAYVTGVNAALAAAQVASQDPAIDAADAKVRSLATDLTTDLAALNAPIPVPSAPKPAP